MTNPATRPLLLKDRNDGFLNVVILKAYFRLITGGFDDFQADQNVSSINGIVRPMLSDSNCSYCTSWVNAVFDVFVGSRHQLFSIV